MSIEQSPTAATASGIGRHDVLPAAVVVGHRDQDLLRLEHLEAASLRTPCAIRRRGPEAPCAAATQMPTAILPSVTPAASSCLSISSPRMTPELYSSWPTHAVKRGFQTGDIRADQRHALVDGLLDRGDPLVARIRHHGDAVESALQRGLEERLVRRGVERGVAEDLERDPIVARRVLGAGLHPLGEGVQPVQDVGDLDVAVVRRGSRVLRRGAQAGIATGTATIVSARIVRSRLTSVLPSHLSPGVRSISSLPVAAERP